MKIQLKSLVMATLAATTLFIAAPMAHAQRGQGFGRGMGGFNQGPMQLLRRGDVQKDLKLTDDEKTKLSDLQTKQRSDMQAMFQGGGNFQQMTDDERQAMMKKMQDMNAGYNTQAEAILTADQKARLDQITVQIEGNGILNDPKFHDKLKVTADQDAKVKDLQTKQQDANRSLMQKVQNQEMDMTEARAAMQKNNEAMNGELGKLLTDDQKKLIADWSGPKFDRDPADDQPRRGGGGGGR